jgi:hypothetical protein
LDTIEEMFARERNKKSFRDKFCDYQKSEGLSKSGYQNCLEDKPFQTEKDKQEMYESIFVILGLVIVFAFLRITLVKIRKKNRCGFF